MKILILSDDHDTLEASKDLFSSAIQVEVAANRLSARERFIQDHYDLVFFDYCFLQETGKTKEQAFRELREKRPGVRIVVLCQQEQVRETMAIIKAGADSYLTYPIDPLELQNITEQLIQQERRQAELQVLRDSFWSPNFQSLVHTNSPRMTKLYEMVRDVAPTNSTVLLQGETGVGKGVLARLIHHHSSRKENQFVHVHCGAIPDNLVESELFGHEKGAFTGAVRRKLGRFELADKGTIFLDEIATLTPAAQVKLLQVMQDSMFQRVGGESDIHVNVRIIAATNESLKNQVEAGHFRADLFYRLNVFPLELPALRDRVEDLPAIIQLFLDRFRAMGGKNIEGIQPETLQALCQYRWPGNIRELENLVERACILEKSGILSNDSFPLDIFQRLDDQAILPLNLDLPLAEARNRNTENFERQYLKELLVKTKGRIGPAAEQAGISARQLNNLMNKYKLAKEDFKDPQ